MTILGFYHQLFLIIQELFLLHVTDFFTSLIFRKWKGNGEINVLPISKPPTKKTNLEEWPDIAGFQMTYYLYLTEYGVLIQTSYQFYHQKV